MSLRLGIIHAMLLATCTPSLASDDAGGWVVRKNSSNQNCYVQKTEALAAVAQDVLGKFDSRKAACSAALEAHTTDIGEAASNPKVCGAYTPNSTSVCASEGIKLP